VTAVGTEKLDLFVAKFLPVAIKIAFALRTGHPKNFRHGASWHQERKFEIRISKFGTLINSLDRSSPQRRKVYRDFDF
jgi:hypothetical protein